MNSLKYRGILYFIGGVIIATLCIQVYWNYKNYQSGKQQLINDVQTSLDNAVDNYYTRLAQQQTIGLAYDSIPPFDVFRRIQNQRGISPRDSISGTWANFSVRDSSIYNRISILRSGGKDSVKLEIRDSFPHQFNGAFLQGEASLFWPVEMLTSKIVVSFSEEALPLVKIDSALQSELERKNINIEYGLVYKGHFNHEEQIRPEIVKSAKLNTASLSPYFYNNHALSVHFSNITLAVLKKNLLGIFLSFLLVGSVLFCLLYLLRIIKRQKQLAEVKNDLISNITHEFKTPIATIGVAMEGIRNFNSEKDPEKNLRYAEISGQQVQKLNEMVEKLLETATLDSEQLHLNLEEKNLVDLLRNAANKEDIPLENKTISFTASEEEIDYPIDAFHFENAINNIVDNAIKYGGDAISVGIQKNGSSVDIDISDSGKTLSEAHKKQIFEKFYRVPKGNTHDVKGFGIGLYYSKKIIEKHGGKIALQLKDWTTFKISLPLG